MPWDDRAMEMAIGRLLRVGVTFAATVVLVGGAIFLRQSGAAWPDYHTFHGVAAELRGPVGIFAGVMRGDGASVIQMGLLLLIATPVARVVLAALGFLAEKDRMYAGISTAVLCILLWSLFEGR
jgi:uncharacterized membrane protein